MTDDWNSYRVFLACHRSGSLRGGAKALGVNHATAARALAALEEALGAKVFHRSVGGLRLSDTGRLLIQHVEEIEQQTQHIQRRLAGLDAQPSGLLRVSVPPALAQSLIAPELADFAARYPNIEVEMLATNRVSNLLRSEADVSLRVARKVTDDVVGRRLLRYVTGAFAAPSYLERVGPLQTGDGSGACWIGWSAGSEWVQQTPFPKAAVKHRLADIHAQMEAAKAGLGMAWVPCFLGDRVEGLVRVPGAEPLPDFSIWLLLHPDLRQSARVRAFVDFFAERVLAQAERFQR
jgi:molybdate transport repressor ModE-like protein